MAEKSLNISISCPFCASPVNYISGSHSCRCTSCGRNIKIVLTGGIFSYRWNPDMKDLTKVARRGISDLLQDTKFRIIDEDGIYVPVWRASGRVVGFISGRKKIKKIPYVVSTGDGSSVTYYRKEGGEQIKRIIDTGSVHNDTDNGFFREFYPSLKFSELEDNFSLSLFDEEKMRKFGKIFFPEKTIERAVELFKEQLKVKAVGLYEKKDFDYLYLNLDVISYNLCLIFHPVYLVRFVSEKFEGFVVIDCVKKTVFGRRMNRKKRKVQKSRAKKNISNSILGIFTFILAFLSTKGSILSLIGIVGLAFILGYIFREYYGS